MSKFTILLVDDDADVRAIVRDSILLLKPDVDIYEVTNGLEALAFLKNSDKFKDAPRPSLVCLDIEMPLLSGQGVLKTIKGDKDLRDIPVIMMTGLDDDRQKLEAALNGANSYTLKSTNPSKFLETVNAVMTYWTKVHQTPTVMH